MLVYKKLALLSYYKGLVLLVELVKLAATLVRARARLPPVDPPALRRSLRFLLPSLLYAANNNIYLLGLSLVPPPVCRSVITRLRVHLTGFRCG